LKKRKVNRQTDKQTEKKKEMNEMGELTGCVVAFVAGPFPLFWFLLFAFLKTILVFVLVFVCSSLHSSNQN